MIATLSPENRFHRSLSSVTEEELLLAIRKNWQDADQARAELRSRGWKDHHIDQFV